MKKIQNKPKVRNRLVASAMFRKAGAHTKTNKAKRKAEKQQFNKGRNDSPYFLDVIYA